MDTAGGPSLRWRPFVGKKGETRIHLQSAEWRVGTPLRSCLGADGLGGSLSDGREVGQENNSNNVCGRLSLLRGEKRDQKCRMQ